ncbi:hypothetical protein LWI28_023530 [Acer negundo]|uniref:DUF4283 domain-containing protein n=1 Tax=Acer negundo TaxID=4023 RepID=A0AAD5NFI8_ACENE|nr:hypothetical protein LWI28_023530 [Acer negundo]
MISEGPDRPAMELSSDLKEQLCKPWTNALLLKIIGRPHIFNFMLLKLNQKWPFISQWQLMDLEDGYFVARFQMLEDLDFVLTRGPWVITNQYLVVQKRKPNFVPGEEDIQRMQYASKRSGNMGNVGKNIISDRKNSPHKHGVGNSCKLSSIETGINLSVKETMNVLPTDLKGRNNNTNMGGSRFAILSEELDEVVTVNRSQTRTGS